MPPNEIIAQKRLESQQMGAAQAAEQRSIGAVMQSAQLVAQTVAREADTSRRSTQPVVVMNDNLASRDDVQAVTAAVTGLKQASDSQLSTFSTLFTQLMEAATASHGTTTAQTTEVFRQLGTDMTENLVSLRETNQNGTVAVLQALQSVISALNKPEKELPAPVVTVEAPQVTVQERKIDFSPVIKAIESLKQAETKEDDDTIDLDDYKASDIKDSGKNLQYIGFIHPSGAWYIIENNIKDDTMRYLFGTTDYTSHFQSAASYEYKVLNEAVNATV